MYTTRRCEIMQYTEYLGCTVEEFEEKVKNIPFLKTYALIEHDKDVKEDGTPKKPHVHCVATFTQAKTIESIANCLDIEPQYINKIRKSTRAAQMYLIHRNNPEKAQYQVSDVKANFDYSALVQDTPALVSVDTVLSNIDNGLCRPYNITEYVDIQTYSKYKRIFLNAFEYHNNKNRSMDRDMKCYYFYGSAGVGKTTFAKSFAMGQGWSVYVSSGGKNPLDDYGGQDCIILDDIRGSVFSLADFLKLTDNNTDSLIGCRYYNKSISYCRAIICTSVMSLEELYAGVTDVNKEPLAQLYRRFEAVGHVTADKIHFYAYNPDKQTLEYTISGDNPVKMLFDEKYREDKKTQMIKLFGLTNVTSDGFVTVPEEELPYK